MNDRPKTVLVVEDDEAVRESLCELLQEEGYLALSADNGRTALVQLRALTFKPDLILLDLMMPEMNGWQFRQEQSRDAEISGIPVVLMSASLDLRGIQVDEVLQKPVKLAKLLQSLRCHTGGLEEVAVSTS